jgi:predicted CXXCH cytochrome family protein
MTRKTLKIALAAVATLLVTLTAGVVIASTKTQSTGLPEYLGSEACLGCHTEQYVNWEGTAHANGLITEIKTPADLPPIDKAPAELQAEIKTATHNFHGRLMKIDWATGEMKYLGVEINSTGDGYVANTRRGSSWDGTCSGCHAGTKDQVTKERIETGIGCESCHGPGREHILGKGDPSKIWNSSDPTKSCASCHSGYNAAPNSTRFPVGFRPGMTLDQVGFMVAKIDQSKPAQPQHHKGAVPQWQASAHANAAYTLNANDHAQGRCYECHSGEAREIIEGGGTFNPKDHKVTDGVTCTTCHDPHNASIPNALREEPKALCESCHTAEIAEGASLKAGATAHHPNKEMLAGYGAVGITNTVGAHTGEATCAECHMTGGNHEMEVVRPDQVAGTTQKDSCTSCHTDSSPEARGMYLDLWQTKVTAKMKDMKSSIDVIDAKLKTNPSALTGDLLAKYQAAKTNYTFVDADGSHGAHNFEYAMKILTAAQKDVEAARAATR